MGEAGGEDLVIAGQGGEDFSPGLGIAEGQGGRAVQAEDGGQGRRMCLLGVDRRGKLAAHLCRERHQQADCGGQQGDGDDLELDRLAEQRFAHHSAPPLSSPTTVARFSSLALIRSIGFRYEGKAERYLKLDGAWQDHLFFALTAEEWPIKRP